MTANEVREHNVDCDDSKIIWCECYKPNTLLLSCARCGGAVEGILMLSEAGDEVV